MKLHHFLLIALAAGAMHAADEKAPKSNNALLFEKLKTLVGEWESPGDKSKLVYELTGAGTTLIEKYSSANHTVMHTMYHLDGDRLMLTHYCMAGNQPRMVAESFNAKTGEASFKFLDATNMSRAGAGHMDNVHMKFIDADHFNTVWQYVEDGKPKFTEDKSYTRVR